VEIIQAFQDAFLKKTLAEWEATLAGLDLCVSPIRTPPEALDSALFRERRMVLEVDRPDGTTETTLGVAVKMSATPGSVRTPSAQFGQHTREILEEIGYSPEQIRQLEARNVI